MTKPSKSKTSAKPVAGKPSARPSKKAAPGAGESAASAKAPKSLAKKASAKPSGLRGALGCCTLTGSGPDQQYERVTKAKCRQLALAAGKNDHWVPGECAEPSRAARARRK